MHNQYVGAMTC